MARKKGSPNRSSGGIKSEMISLRVSPIQLEMIKQEAKKRGVDVTSLILFLVYRHLQGQFDEDIDAFFWK